MASQGPMKPLKRVLVAGATHGNEMSGVFLARHWLKDPVELHRSTFSVTPFIANPRAMEKCVRYMQQDLNRSFKKEFLTAADSEDEPYEVQRAKEINKMYGPKGSPEAFDFLFDMHNTTSNMGACIIVNSPENYFALHMVNYIQKNYKETKCPIYIYKLADEEAYTIDSVCKNGVALEVGPQPQGVVRADALAHMKALIKHGLDFIEKFNQGTTFPEAEVEAFLLLSREDYPRHTDGEISGVIHPNLQDKDFLPLNPGDAIFQTLDGKELAYSGDVTIYPAFINEAAYYEKKIAFAKMEKKTLSIPVIQAQMD
ncbi:N-acyl-aromatic-L-amino acid amidohydrolase (carboxylate-forming)-like [Ambystoma mexicanum]|uniref:N-acyl-aromatic-L-amino acid amidohydrolase (carboxylate-forming)-like n=1 Tax=Ambystoma mexicanum TaxID=8296 RepID=UPI0037E90BE4